MGACRTPAFQVGFPGSCVVTKPAWGQRRLGGGEDGCILASGACGDGALCSASSKAGTAVCLSAVWQSTLSLSDCLSYFAVSGTGLACPACARLETFHRPQLPKVLDEFVLCLPGRSGAPLPMPTLHLCLGLRLPSLLVALTPAFPLSFPLEMRILGCSSSLLPCCCS